MPDNTAPPAPAESPLSFPRTLEQFRAEFAWDQVQAVKKEVFPEYLSLIRGFPAMVQTNGLGQALAFLFSGKQPAKRVLSRQLQYWLCERRPGQLPPIYGEHVNNEPQGFYLLHRLVMNDSARMRRATHETKELCLWLKRFAEGTAILREASSSSPETEEEAPQDAATTP
jgi:CRISPR-associated protein Cmr5